MIAPAPLHSAQWEAILEGQGHHPCPGVTIEFGREIRPAKGATPRQYVTIFRPAKIATPAPGLVAFHGGGFFVGDPNGAGARAKTLALTCGIITVSASYRVGSAERPTGTAILDDASSAFSWVHAQSGALGLDPARIAVAGESAGVLLAGHLAVRSPWMLPTLEHAALPHPVAFYAQWGPVDFVSRWYDKGENPGAERNILGPGGYAVEPGLYHQLSVLTHTVRRSLPPRTLYLWSKGRRGSGPAGPSGSGGLASWRGTRGANGLAKYRPPCGGGQPCGARTISAQHRRFCRGPSFSPQRNTRSFVNRTLFLSPKSQLRLVS